MSSIEAKSLPVVKKLYYEQKLTAQEIANHFKVTLKAVYYFMRSNNLRRRSYSTFNRLRFEKSPLSFKIKNPVSLQDRKLKTTGIVLYWGEGYKALGGHSVDFANCDPAMVVTFLKFLRKICGVNESRLRVLLYCYSNQDIPELLKFWSKLTHIPLSQFSKPYVRNDFQKEKIGKMKFGMVHIRYADIRLRQIILDWIEEHKKIFAPVV